MAEDGLEPSSVRLRLMESKRHLGSRTIPQRELPARYYLAFSRFYVSFFYPGRKVLRSRTELKWSTL